MTSVFTDVNNFINYVEKIISDSMDPNIGLSLVTLREYVIDSTFAHGEPTPKIELFKDLTLKEIKKYNTLVEDCDKDHWLSSMCFSSSTRVYQFMRDKNIPVYNELVYNEDGDVQYYKLRDLPQRNFVTGSDGRTKTYCAFTNCNGRFNPTRGPERVSILPISQPKIHDDSDYILYFINKDFNLNRLRKLLIYLVKQEMKTYSDEFDNEKGYRDDYVRYNELLKHYCRELMHKCRKYLDKSRDKPTPLTI